MEMTPLAAYHSFAEQCVLTQPHVKMCSCTRTDLVMCVQGCPCTPELLCQSDNLGIFRKRQCKPSSLRYCTVNLVEKAQLGGKRTCKGFTGSRKGARTGAPLVMTVRLVFDAVIPCCGSCSWFTPCSGAAQKATSAFIHPTHRMQ